MTEITLWRGKLIGELTDAECRIALAEAIETISRERRMAELDRNMARCFEETAARLQNFKP